MKENILIAGSGFGGLQAALKLREKNKKANITVIDKSSFFTYQVSLHTLISGRVKENKITINLKDFYKKHKIKFFQDEIVKIIPLEKSAITMARKIIFDYLVLALGGVTNYFGIEGLKENSFELKRPIDAMKIRNKVEEELEKAKHYTEPINMIVVGAGLTGVEVAAELADMGKDKTKIILIDSLPTIMSGFSKKVVEYTEKVLKKKRVTIMTNTHIKKASDGKITLKDEKELYSNVIVWCGGIKPNPLTYKTSLKTNEKGAIMVNDYLQTNHRHIYAIGDCSYMYSLPQPTTALTAIQQAEIASHNINSDITKGEKKAYVQKDLPYLIALGKRKGIMIRNKKVKTGLMPSIIKKFIETYYLLTRKNWRWPINRIDFK